MILIEMKPIGMLLVRVKSEEIWWRWGGKEGDGGEEREKEGIERKDEQVEQVAVIVVVV